MMGEAQWNVDTAEVRAKYMNTCLALALACDGYHAEFQGVMEPDGFHALILTAMVVGLGREQRRKEILEYLSQHPDATSEQIGDLLGVSGRRDQMLVRLVGLATRTQRSSQLLTKREIDILRLMAKGSSNRQIGDTLGVTKSTITNHVSVILDKFKANNRAHAVALAIQQGLISLDELKPADTPPNNCLPVTSSIWGWLGV